jgi:ubiquinone/menaquinone biosynthesis C-methylase UbiE
MAYDKTKKKTKVVLIEATATELKVQQNSVDILLIKKDINDIKNNHLKHIEADIKKIDRKVEKIDHRLWGIGMLIVASAVANYLI